jgi:hypothetical protein
LANGIVDGSNGAELNWLCISQRSNRQQSVSRFQQLSDSSFASAGPKEARGCQNQ